MSENTISGKVTALGKKNRLAILNKWYAADFKVSKFLQNFKIGDEVTATIGKEIETPQGPMEEISYLTKKGGFLPSSQNQSGTITGSDGMHAFAKAQGEQKNRSMS